MEDNQRSSERRAAFLHSLQVLDHLKRLSPQAEQYYNILSSFHNAIKSYKEQSHREKHASRETLVDRIFMPDNPAMDFDAADSTPIQLPIPDSNSLGPPFVDWEAGLDMSGMDNVPPIDPALGGDNDVIMRMLSEMDRYTDPFMTEEGIDYT